MGTTSRVANSALEPFLLALHSSASLHEVLRTCAQFANELVPFHAYGWYQFKPDTVATGSCASMKAKAADAIRSSPGSPPN